MELEIFRHLLDGFFIAFEPLNLALTLLGVVVGLFIGAMPGLGSVNGVAILLPMTFLVPPTGAIIFLAAIMLASCVVIIFNWFHRKSPPSRSEEVYMDDYALKSFLLVGGGLTVAIGLIHVIGVYGSVFLFLIYYIRFLGKHTWLTTASIAVSTPVITFFFFDVALRIVLPKGYTEPLFIPLYDIFL